MDDRDSKRKWSPGAGAVPPAKRGATRPPSLEEQRKEIADIYAAYDGLHGQPVQTSGNEALFLVLLKATEGSFAAKRLAARLLPRFAPQYPSHIASTVQALSSLLCSSVEATENEKSGHRRGYRAMQRDALLGLEAILGDSAALLEEEIRDGVCVDGLRCALSFTLVLEARTRNSAGNGGTDAVENAVALGKEDYEAGQSVGVREEESAMPAVLEQAPMPTTNACDVDDGVDAKRVGAGRRGTDAEAIKSAVIEEDELQRGKREEDEDLRRCAWCLALAAFQASPLRVLEAVLRLASGGEEGDVGHAAMVFLRNHLLVRSLPHNGNDAGGGGGRCSRRLAHGMGSIDAPFESEQGGEGSIDGGYPDSNMENNNNKKKKNNNSSSSSSSKTTGKQQQRDGKRDTSLHRESSDSVAARRLMQLSEFQQREAAVAIRHCLRALQTRVSQYNGTQAMPATEHEMAATAAAPASSSGEAIRRVCTALNALAIVLDPKEKEKQQERSPGKAGDAKRPARADGVPRRTVEKHVAAAAAAASSGAASREPRGRRRSSRSREATPSEPNAGGSRHRPSSQPTLGGPRHTTRSSPSPRRHFSLSRARSDTRLERMIGSGNGGGGGGDKDIHHVSAPHRERQPSEEGEIEEGEAVPGIDIEPVNDDVEMKQAPDLSSPPSRDMTKTMTTTRTNSVFDGGVQAPHRHRSRTRSRSPPPFGDRRPFKLNEKHRSFDGTTRRRTPPAPFSREGGGACGGGEGRHPGIIPPPHQRPPLSRYSPSPKTQRRGHSRSPSDSADFGGGGIASAPMGRSRSRSPPGGHGKGRRYAGASLDPPRSNQQRGWGGHDPGVGERRAANPWVRERDERPGGASYVYQDHQKGQPRYDATSTTHHPQRSPPPVHRDREPSLPPQGAASSIPPDATRTLWVGGIRFETAATAVQRQLMEAFGRFGNIVGHRFMERSGCAFIDFARVEDAVRARSSLRGATVASSSLNVEFKGEGRGRGRGGPPPLPAPPGSRGQMMVRRGGGGGGGGGGMSPPQRNASPPMAHGGRDIAPGSAPAAGGGGGGRRGEDGGYGARYDDRYDRSREFGGAGDGRRYHASSSPSWASRQSGKREEDTRHVAAADDNTRSAPQHKQQQQQQQHRSSSTGKVSWRGKLARSGHVQCEAVCFDGSFMGTPAAAHRGQSPQASEPLGWPSLIDVTSRIDVQYVLGSLVPSLSSDRRSVVRLTAPPDQPEERRRLGAFGAYLQGKQRAGMVMLPPGYAGGPQRNLYLLPASEAACGGLGVAFREDGADDLLVLVAPALIAGRK